MSTSPLHSALVRIFFKDVDEHLPVGAGFLVAPRHILTCAHVVNASLGLSEDNAEQPVIPVWLDFPLLAPDIRHEALQARVKVWHPIRSPQQPSEVEDIAVLELANDVVLPPGTRPAWLVKGGSFLDHPVGMFGFPEGRDDGDWLNGTLRGPLANGWVQIDTGRDSRPVRPGFSGGPVWNSRENAAAGMMVAADIIKGIYNSEDILSAYLIPAETLLKVCSDIPIAIRERVEPAPSPFSHLWERFAEMPYFPSWEALQQGQFYFHTDYHKQLELHLAEKRRALIVGRSGSGKTALAYSFGFRFSQEDPVNRVFYTDTAPRTPTEWLEAMCANDRPEYLFVIDNAHDFPDACNDLLDRFGAVRHAHLLLVSQPLPESLAGPEDKSYLGLLHRHRVEPQVDTQLEEVLTVFVQLAQRGQGAVPSIGDKQKLLHKCQGNLHLLKYYFMAWEKQPQLDLSDINEREVLANIYSRYLNGNTHKEALVRLATLAQFEIPADRVYFADADALEQDSLVERRSSRCGDPQLRLFHPTPAHYLVLAHLQHTRGCRHFNAWTLSVLTNYLFSNPSNFFEVFYQLYRNKQRDLQEKLFAEPTLEELFQTHLDNLGRIECLDIIGAAHFIRGVWKWEKAASGSLAAHLVERFDRYLSPQDYATLHQLWLGEVSQLLSFNFASATMRRWAAHLDYPRLGESSREMGLAMVRGFLQKASQTGVDKVKLRTFAEGLDFKALGESSREIGLATVTVFLQKATQIGVDKAKLRTFADGLDFKVLGESSREVGLATVRHFLEEATQIGVDKAKLRAFADRLDFKALGEDSRAAGLGTVKHFLEVATKAGVDRAKLQEFAEELDFKALGERSRKAGLETVRYFVILAHRAGINQKSLREFCAQLDWYKLGQSVFDEPDDLRNMLFVFDLLFSQSSISPDMVRQFMEGVGWDILRQWVQEVFSIDVLAACRDVLQVKCRFELLVLQQRSIDFSDPELWRRSLFRPVGKVSEGLKLHMARYFKDALRLLKQVGAYRFLRRAHTLHDLNVLIHNLEQINPAWLSQEMEPRLRAWDVKKWQKLFNQADVRNLSTFLHWFSPHNGLFQWPLPAGLRFPLDGKIRLATLLELAHLLFNFFFIQRPEQSEALALRLQVENGYIQEQLVAATLEEIEFFYWNYWLALPPEYEAELFRLPDLPDSLLPKLGAKLENKSYWLGLAGSWRMATAPGLDTIQSYLSPVEVLRICRELAAKKSPVLIRSLIGLSLVCPELAEADRLLFTETLENTMLPGLNIPAQERALAYLKNWLESNPN